MASNPFSTILVAPIRLYQKHISPGLPRTCRYHPSCSQYAIDSLQTHGALKGSILATWRILRCNPWSRGGVDYTPPRGSWKAPEWVPPDDWVGHDIEGKPTRREERQIRRARREEQKQADRPVETNGEQRRKPSTLQGRRVDPDLNDGAPASGADFPGATDPEQKES